MLVIIQTKADDRTLKQVAEDFDGYVKVVVDVEKGILVAGGSKHVDGEQLLLKDGSRQKNLWGGGIDLETNEIDYDSMINLRPDDNNSSREVLSAELRQRMDKIIRALLQ